jgi:hypothetical protein
MSALTRRRSPDRRQECREIYYSDIHVGRIIERAVRKHLQRVRGKFWLVATTFRLWNRAWLGVPIHSWVDNAREPRRPAVREMRLQDALFLHGAGEAGICAPRLRVHQMPEHTEFRHRY